jgi:hypothetical protein
VVKNKDEPEEERKVQNDQTDYSDDKYRERGHKQGPHVVGGVSGDIWLGDRVTELQVRVCVMVFEKEINGNAGREKRDYC